MSEKNLHQVGSFDFITTPHSLRITQNDKLPTKDYSSSFERVINPKRKENTPHHHLVPNWLLSDHSYPDALTKHKQKLDQEKSEKSGFQPNSTSLSPSLPALLHLRDENPNFTITLPPPLPSPFQFVPLSGTPRGEGDYPLPSPSSSSFPAPSSASFPSPRLSEYFTPHSPASRSTSFHPPSHDPFKSSSQPAQSPLHDRHERRSAPISSLLSPNPMELIQSDPFINAIPPKSIPYFRPDQNSEYSLGSRRSELHHHYSDARQGIFKPSSSVPTGPHSPSWVPPTSYSPNYSFQNPPSHDEPPPPQSSYVPQEGFSHSSDKFQSVPKSSHGYPPSFPPSQSAPIPIPSQRTQPSSQFSHSSSPFSSPSVSRSAPLGQPPTKMYKHFEENEYNVRMQSAANSAPIVATEQKFQQRRMRQEKVEDMSTTTSTTQKGGKEKRRRTSTNEKIDATSSPQSEEQTEKPEIKFTTSRSTRATNPNKIQCTCESHESKTTVKCTGCDRLFHSECAGPHDPNEYVCAECKKQKARFPSPHEPVSSSSPVTKEVSEPPEPVEEEEEENGIRVGNELVSLSTIAKQPWLDGWATARNFAVQYLMEAKKLGNDITENRKLPKQIEVRMANKGKRPWRQAEVLLAIQFLKTAELVETSTKKGTTVREPFKTMDELIKRAQSVTMPSIHPHRRAYAAW